MNKYMLIALKEAKKSLKTDDVPVGAVIVKNNKIISRAHNTKEKSNDVTKHAEMVAISQACKKLKNWHLDGCVMYVTLEPCMMCCGAIEQSRISKVFYSTENEKFGFTKNIDKIVKLDCGICQNESVKLLKSFFQNKRN